MKKNIIISCIIFITFGYYIAIATEMTTDEILGVIPSTGHFEIPDSLSVTSPAYQNLRKVQSYKEFETLLKEGHDNIHGTNFSLVSIHDRISLPHFLKNQPKFQNVHISISEGNQENPVMYNFKVNCKKVTGYGGIRFNGDLLLSVYPEYKKLD